MICGSYFCTNNVFLYCFYKKIDILVMRMEKNFDKNVIEISEEKIKELLPRYSKKRIEKACVILKMIAENPNVSIEELRIALNVTDRTVARYLAELKNKDIIERKGPDNGGEWKITLS